MRPLLALPILVSLAACGVENDTANDRVTVTYDQEKIERSAEKAEQAAESAAKSAANVAGATADAVKREVGDIDVDVKVSRDKPAEPAAQ